MPMKAGASHRLIIGSMRCEMNLSVYTTKAKKVAEKLCTHMKKAYVFNPNILRNNKRPATRVAERFSLAAELGFEPRMNESESLVLPLHHSAMPQSAVCLKF